MTTEEKHNKLEACWKGEKCPVCMFPLDQREFEDIIETKFGYMHLGCAEDVRENEVNKENNKKLDI